MSRRGRRRLVVPASLSRASPSSSAPRLGQEVARAAHALRRDRSAAALRPPRDRLTARGRPVPRRHVALALAASSPPGRSSPSAPRSSRALRCGRARIFVAVAAGYAVVLFGVFLAGRQVRGDAAGMDEASTSRGRGSRMRRSSFSRRRCALVDRRVACGQAGRPPRARSNGRDRRGPRRRASTHERALARPGVAARAQAARERCDAGADGARIPVAPEPFGFVLEAACHDLR